MYVICISGDMNDEGMQSSLLGVISMYARCQATCYWTCA